MNLPEKSKQLRQMILQTIYSGGAGHWGGTSSILDILVYMAYELEIPVKSILIGKGHSCLASWCIMTDRGEMKKETLESYGKDGGLGGQFDLSNGALCAGSLGHALGVGVGLALANSKKKIYVILGDSELSEGSVTEAAEFAGNHNLKNLTLIADFNGFGVSGPAQAKLEGKTGILARFEALGWESVAVNGHDFKDIPRGLTGGPRDHPRLIAAKTIKGYGVKQLIGTHHGRIGEADYKAALQELSQ